MKNTISKNNVLNGFASKVDRRFPFVYVDVGAMGGIPKKWDLLSDVMKVVAFEPDSREFEKLKSTDRVTYINCVLHSKSEELPFYIAKEGGKSSVYKPNQRVLDQFQDIQRFETVEEKRIMAEQVKKLDSVLEEYEIDDVDFIKLDTQGSELSILEGGRGKTISKLFGIQVEVEFIEMYDNQPLFWQVDKFLNDHGFQLIDLRRAYWKRKDYCDFLGKGQLTFGDGLYFKRTDVIERELLGTEDRNYAVSKIYKCILTCMVYKMFDYAVSIANIGLRQDYLKKSEYEHVLSTLKRYAKKGTVPNFWGKDKVYSAFNNICNRLKPPSYLGWADSDQRIGNTKDI